jgi:pyruvoyl-dependent arginine decarboxylase (PvlArgDC)
MAGNATPNFTKNGNINSVLVTAANTSSQGGGTIATDIFKAFTADSTNGSYVERVDWIATGTAATTTTGTVARVFISSVTSGATTSSNTWLIGEVALPAIGADNASTAVNVLSVPVGFRIPAGYTILVTNHAAPATNTAWRANVIGGDY